MSKTAVTSPELAPPVGPFSQAIEVGGFLYFSGQVGQDPATGKVVEGGIVAETERVFRNLSAVLKAAGKSFDDVARVGVFLTSMSDYGAMNQSSSVLLAGMENGCWGRSLSLSFRMESTTDGSRIRRLAKFARMKTNSFGLITPKAGRSVRLSQSKVVWWTRPGSNRRPPHCERGITKAKTRRHNQLAF